jgi:hypothetical protein
MFSAVYRTTGVPMIVARSRRTAPLIIAILSTTNEVR